MDLLITESAGDYELIDSGDGEKLEKYGDYILSRPDPQALWRKRFVETEWKKAHAVFIRDVSKGEWKISSNVPERWQISFAGMKFWIKPTAFKHTGIFPEQSKNWTWTEDLIHERLTNNSQEEIEILNLFGYTGGASLAAARAGAKVVHVDSSKSAVNWAKENASISDFGAKPIRWIVEDARVFVKREIKRGRKYAGIIMDPPSFGHGPTAELWKIEEHFIDLVEDCVNLLSDKPLFMIINGYSSGYSAMAYENVLKSIVNKYGGTIEKGELGLKESFVSGADQRILPSGIFARWKA